MKKTKTKLKIINLVIIFCFGVLFVTSMAVANNSAPQANAVYIYNEPSIKTH